MGCGTGFMRGVLVFFNTLFLLGGLAGLGGGIWMAVDPSGLFEFLKLYFNESEYYVRNAAYVLIGASCLIVLVAALGCWGGCRRNRCALGMYAVLMVILLVIQFAAIAFVAIFDSKLKEDALDSAAESLKKNYKTSKPYKDAIDDIQKELKCCGIKGPSDYATIGGPPKSCGSATRGCYSAIRGWIKKNLGLVIGITVAVIVFQIILFIFAVCLCRNSDFYKHV